MHAPITPAVCCLPINTPPPHPATTYKLYNPNHERHPTGHRFYYPAAFMETPPPPAQLGSGYLGGASSFFHVNPTPAVPSLPH